MTCGMSWAEGRAPSRTVFWSLQYTLPVTETVMSDLARG
jgi:hypothetical protein